LLRPGADQQTETHLVGGSVAPHDIARWKLLKLGQHLAQAGVVGSLLGKSDDAGQ
jgi:hypothetical protein